jgi:phosphoribosylformimino-5-aminoimidazole carboxamide ribonucleotide (ProFAR) isomerase
MGTVDDSLQSLDYLDQCGHVGDLVEGWSLQLGQQGIDLLLGSAIQDGFHVSQSAGGGFQHVEDLLLLDVTHRVRLVGMALLAQHPTVKLDADKAQPQNQVNGMAD